MSQGACHCLPACGHPARNQTFLLACPDFLWRQHTGPLDATGCPVTLGPRPQEVFTAADFIQYIFFKVLKLRSDSINVKTPKQNCILFSDWDQILERVFFTALFVTHEMLRELQKKINLCSFARHDD